MALVPDAVPAGGLDRDAAVDGATGDVVFEGPLRAIIEASAASAGAVCLFDSREGALRLATAIGLSEEGCHRLRHVRTGLPASWDVPLLSVLNRRPYVIDGAAEKYDVPHLVEPATAMRTIVCLPLWADGMPEGSVVLVTLTPHALAETDIPGLEPLLCALAGVVHAAHVEPAGQAVAPVLPVGTSDEIAHLTADLEHGARQGVGVEALLAALAGTERHRLYLTAALEQTTRAEHARVAAAIAGAQAAVASARVIVDGTRAGDDRSRVDLVRLAALEREVVALRAECERLTHESGERRVVPAPASATAAPEAPPAKTSPAAGPPTAAPSPVTTAPAPAAAAEGVQTIIVLDPDAAWDAFVPPNDGVARLGPGDDLVARLRAAGAATVVANVAAPGVLGALATARASGWERPVVGCIAAPGGAGVLLLGRIDVVAVPLDTAALARLVVGRFPRGTRLMTAGEDAETLGRLRTALVDGGMSVSMVWDAKQAADLLEVVRPGLVLVDLGLQRREGFEIVLRLADTSPMPSTILVVGQETPADGFANGLADPQRAARTVPRDRVLAQLRTPETPRPA